MCGICEALYHPSEKLLTRAFTGCSLDALAQSSLLSELWAVPVSCGNGRKSCIGPPPTAM